MRKEPEETRMKKRLLFILIVLVSASLACQAIERVTKTEQPSNVLFQDDFSDPSSGWDRITEATGQSDYVDGKYRIFVDDTNTDVWSNPGLDFTDVRVEVDATKVAGPDDNDFGVTCRTESADNFYFFIISSDGYYGIGKVKGDQQDLIQMDALQPVDAIKQGGTTNHIRADCIGDALTLYVNGQKINEVHDAEFTSGDVGLMAGSFDTPGTDIHFDNFQVLKP
jgi:hypothetical protein